MRDASRRSDVAPALVIAAAVTAVMLLLALLARRIEPDAALTPIIASDGRLYYLVALASAVGITIITVVRGGAPAPASADVHGWCIGVAPGFAGLAGSLFLVWHHDARAVLLTAAAVGGISFARLALPYFVNVVARHALAQALIAFAVLYFLLAMILSFRTRALYGGTVSGVAVAVMILAELGIEIDYRRVIRTAGVGLVAAELVWTLNYLDLSHWVGAIPVTAAALIGGWLVQREEEAALNRPVAASDSGEERASIARPSE